MYKEGDYVVKSSTGLCRVEGTVWMEGLDHTDQEFLVLVPLTDDRTKIYTPLPRVEETIRRVLDAAEAEEILSADESDALFTVKNERLRETDYKVALRSNSPRMLLSLVRSLYQRRMDRVAQGKKPTSLDEHYLRLSEELLSSELAFALGCEKKEITDRIAAMIS